MSAELAPRGGRALLASWSRVAALRGTQFVLLILTAAVAAFARFAVSPLQESMRAALHLSDNQVAVIQGPALAFPMVIAAVPLGLVVDRRSRVGLLCVFALLDLGGSVLTAVAVDFPTLFIARCLVGLAVTTMSTTVFSLLSDLYEPDRRGRASMGVIIGQYAGMSVAFALGGALLASFGTGAVGWRPAMLWLSGPVAALVVLLPLLREPPRSGIAVVNPTVRESCRALWRLRAVITAPLLGLVTAEMAILAVLTWAGPAFSRSFALPPDRIGIIMAMVVLVSGVAGPFAGGFMADLCQRTGGPRRTTATLGVLAASGVPMSLFAVVPRVAFATILLILLMMTLGSILVAGIALLTIIIPNELRGLCLATLAGAQVLFGVAVAPVTVSLLSDAMGGPTMIGKALACVGVATSVLGALAFAFGARHFPLEEITR